MRSRDRTDVANSCADRHLRWMVIAHLPETMREIGYWDHKDMVFALYSADLCARAWRALCVLSGVLWLCF